jgi:hypothetical protein
MGYSLGSGELKGDPLFVSYAAENFRVIGSSKAIDAGINIGYLLDIDGKGIAGNAFDIGAYEINGDVGTCG